MPLFSRQRNWYQLKVARVTVGLAESNGSLLPGLWLTSPAGWLPRTEISSRTLCSAFEYGLPFPLLAHAETCSSWYSQHYSLGGSSNAASGCQSVVATCYAVSRLFACLSVHSLMACCLDKAVFCAGFEPTVEQSWLLWGLSLKICWVHDIRSL